MNHATTMRSWTSNTPSINGNSLAHDAQLNENYWQSHPSHTGQQRHPWQRLAICIWWHGSFIEKYDSFQFCPFVVRKYKFVNMVVSIKLRSNSHNLKLIQPSTTLRDQTYSLHYSMILMIWLVCQELQQRMLNFLNDQLYQAHGWPFRCSL